MLELLTDEIAAVEARLLALGWIPQESGHRDIVGATPGGIMRQFVASSMRNLHPISNAEGA